MRSDATIALRNPKTATLYPNALRRISYHAADIDKRFVVLTTSFALPALTIEQLYRCRRWQVKLFFKWIKQNLRIKTFYETSDNAVKTQVWIAVAMYAPVAIGRKDLRIGGGMTEMLLILSISLFEKAQLFQVFSHQLTPKEAGRNCNQLSLLDF